MNTESKTMNVQELRHHVRALFQKRFASTPEFSLLAPGRVNLIGEHTDYNDGFVFPMAIERYVAMAARKRLDDTPKQLRLFSEAMDASVIIALDSRPIPGEPHWANYVKGVIAGFMDRGDVLPSLDVVLTSTVPLGSGLSSSAALEVATATLLETALGTTLAPIDKARLCQKAEHEFAKVPCGLMDQLASVLGREAGALYIDCRSQSAKLVPLTDPNVSVLICNSRVKHSLADGEYGKRRAACHEAARILGKSHLRDSSETEIRAARSALPSPLFERALHVTTEDARVVAFADALKRSELERAGQLMYLSHESLSRDYQVSCRELDVLVASAKRIGLEGGVFGSRMTGGGFGGCTVSLVDSRRVSAIIERLTADYELETGIRLEAFVTRPSEGRVWSEPTE
jgi:galactokinase